jgi:hypothetical protein
VLERESETLIIDAKFKGHWEELQSARIQPQTFVGKTGRLFIFRFYR